MSSQSSGAVNGSRPPRPPSASFLVRYRHAEEVALAKGVTVPRLSSTTGRRLRTLSETSAEEPHRPSPDSSASSTAPQRNVLRSRAEMSCMDSYGFRVTVLEKAAEDLYAKENELPTAVRRKWEAMARSQDSWSAVDHAKKKKYCRKGIPEHLRGRVWQLMLGSYGARSTSERRGRYDILKSRPLENADLAGIIERDLDRTFPTHHLFEDGGPRTGQFMLRNILRAYANYNTLVGYCQGMGFLAATLLLQVENEEDTFWALCALMERPPFQFEGLYEPGFPQLRCCFYVLDHLMAEKGKKLHKRLAAASIEPSFYATHWFLTAFSYYLNFGLVCRIWDMFLCEGWKPIYRVALALLLLEERKLLAQPGESELLMTLKDVQEEKDPSELLKTALRIKFKTAQVVELTRDFRLR